MHEAYNRVIRSAAEAGFLEEEALANELAGDFMNGQQEHCAAEQYWSKAHTLYIEWGATAKAAQLLSRKNLS